MPSLKLEEDGVACKCMKHPGLLRGYDFILRVGADQEGYSQLRQGFVRSEGVPDQEWRGPEAPGKSADACRWNNEHHAGGSSAKSHIGSNRRADGDPVVPDTITIDVAPGRCPINGFENVFTDDILAWRSSGPAIPPVLGEKHGISKTREPPCHVHAIIDQLGVAVKYDDHRRRLGFGGSETREQKDFYIHILPDEENLDIIRRSCRYICIDQEPWKDESLLEVGNKYPPRETSDDKDEEDGTEQASVPRFPMCPVATVHAIDPAVSIRGSIHL